MATPVTPVSSTGLEYTATNPLPVTMVLAADAATSPNKTEDTAASSADVGTAVMAVQTASPADAAGAGDYAMLQIKDGRLWVRQLDGVSGSATFTPAAASHTAGDVNGAAADFTLGAPSGCLFLITDVDFLINSGTAEASAWRLHLYTVTPPSALADDAAFDLPAGDQASYVGYIDLGTAVDQGADSQWVQNAQVNRTVKLSGTTLFGYLVNLSTITPAAVAHTVRLRGTPL